MCDGEQFEGNLDSERNWIVLNHDLVLLLTLSLVEMLTDERLNSQHMT